MKRAFLRENRFAAAVMFAAFVVMGWLLFQEPAHTATPSPSLPACEYEDSTTDCYWDASERGNGRGTDFIVFDGRVWYEQR